MQHHWKTQNYWEQMAALRLSLNKMIPYWDLLQDPPSRATQDSPMHPAAVFWVEGPGEALIRTALCLWDHPPALAGEPYPDYWCPLAKTWHQHSSRTQMRTLQGRMRRWSEGTLREGTVPRYYRMWWEKTEEWGRDPETRRQTPVQPGCPWTPWWSKKWPLWG